MEIIQKNPELLFDATNIILEQIVILIQNNLLPDPFGTYAINSKKQFILFEITDNIFIYDEYNKDKNYRTKYSIDLKEIENGDFVIETIIWTKLISDWYIPCIEQRLVKLKFVVTSNIELEKIWNFLNYL